MSLPKYSEYRDSGVEWLGKVPVTWFTRRVKSLFEIKKRISGEDGHKVLSITQHGIKLKDIESNDGQLSMDYSKYQFVYVGDFAMNHMDLLTGYVDISAYFGVTSPDYRVFSVRDADVCDSRFFLYLFQNGYRQRIFYAFGQGSSQLGRWRFPTAKFNDFVFPLPPLDEQVQIASFLDRETTKIDTLIAEQEKLLTLLAEKRQATISHAVTRGLDPNAPVKDSGIPWLGEVPAHWSTPPLRLRYASELGKMLDTGKISGEHLVPYLRNTDVQWGKVNFDDLPEMDIPEVEYARYTVLKGDLMVCEGGEVGRAAVLDEVPSVLGFQKALHRLRAYSSDENPRFMYYTLCCAAKLGVFDGSGQATIAHLTGEQLRAYRFAKPSIDEQNAVVEFLDAEIVRLDSLKAEAEYGIELLSERRSALIAAAVTGKIDLRGTAGAQAA